MKSLLSVFFEGFLGGFAAFLMPCIYPMLPLTISFFSKKDGSRNGAIGQALLYGFSIILIYVIFGGLITAFLGPQALNGLASSGWFNLSVFFLLLIFAISFFGVFEINLPSSLVNKADSISGARSFLGIFFMAFTLSLVSFSCTAGIIGTLLVEAVRSKQYYALVTGMAGFSLALALPFTLAAIFPSALKSLPKSGSWLNSVKVVLGFLELALSLKFLSSFDLVYHTGLLSREVFLVLWIVIFAFLGMYLLGKIKLSHDTALTHVSVPRLFFSLFSFSFALYLVPGLWGAPLTAISGLAPPLSSQEFILRSGSAPAEEVAILPANRKYATLFQEPDGLEGFYDYKEALMYARKVNKPLFIDFTGHSCVNCRKMEQTIWSDPRVRQRLNNNFILVSLYVDEKKELPVSEQYTSKVFGNRVVSVGNLNSDLQATRFNTNSQPFYVVADKDGNALVKPSQYDADVDNYIAFLDKGLQAYKQKYK